MGSARRTDTSDELDITTLAHSKSKKKATYVAANLDMMQPQLIGTEGLCLEGCKFVRKATVVAGVYAWGILYPRCADKIRI
jgi:hypothetical protein